MVETKDFSINKFSLHCTWCNLLNINSGFRCKTKQLQHVKAILTFCRAQEDYIKISFHFTQFKVQSIKAGSHDCNLMFFMGIWFDNVKLTLGK